MSLAAKWVEMYQSTLGVELEAARGAALSKLNAKLGTNHTRGDLWRWEGGAGMRSDRRRFILEETLPWIVKKNGWKITPPQIAEIIDLLTE